MELLYSLHGLDCANCAAKIERKLAKISGIQEVNINFTTKRLYIETRNTEVEALKKELISCIHALEPDVRVEEIRKQSMDGKSTRDRHRSETDDRSHHVHESCGCEKDHAHHDHVSCECEESHAHHDHVSCECEESHAHHDHESCECEESHAHHDHESCGCEGNHAHHDHESCGCGEDHTLHNHKSCECADKHSHTHGSCECDHDHPIKEEREIQGAYKFTVKNLDCASCAQKVEDAIQKLEHVEDAALNFSSSLLFVKLTKEEAISSVQKRIQEATDRVEPGVLIQEKVSSSNEEAEESSNTQRNEIIRLCVGLSLFLAGRLLEDGPYGVWILLIALLVSGGPVIYTAIRNVVRGEVFDENFLMSIATIGAFATGSYDEGVAVMLFYEVGELFQSYAVNRSRKSIASLMNIRAEYANLLVDGKEQRVAPEEVHIDDVIQIRAGERVPLDGILIQGESSLDTSALTGESLPRDISEGDELLAGSVNLNGLIQVRVTKEFGESTVSRILELVENAGSKKAPMEKFITKFARIYTPLVVALAVLLLIVPMVVIEDAVFDDWLYRALTFLVVSCPCALVVSIPLGLFAGIGGASRKGILIKGGNYLEALSDIDTVVFDKTGTLTKGSFHVDEVHAVQHTKEELLELGAYGERYSNHPIAQSIVKEYGKPIDAERISEFQEIAGNGISVKIDGVPYVLGNTKLMMAESIAYETDTPTGTIIHIAKEHTYLGYIVINDEIKETSADAIQALKAEGVKQCVMLTGDRKEVADAVGKKLGLDQVYAQLLPQNKVEQVEALLAKQDGQHKLAFVGDGINDAPVLARADIGVAMGGIGSDAAIEAADLVLMKDDPQALATALSISKKTKRILWQNIIFSLGVKAIVLILTVYGRSSMWMGVIADVGVTLLAVINSMRALRS